MNPTCSVLRERTKQATFSPIAGTAGIKIADLKRSATTIRYLRCRHARLVLYCIFGLEAVLNVAASQLEGNGARDRLRFQLGILCGKTRSEERRVGKGCG